MEQDGISNPGHIGQVCSRAEAPAARSGLREVLNKTWDLAELREWAGVVDGLVV